MRHAEAGERAKWTRPDELRPLTALGRSQAEGLIALLAETEIMRILTSPYVRCVQTVEPLAAVRGLPIETTDLLAEDAGDRALERIVDPAAVPAVWCTHGDVLTDLMRTLIRDGVMVEGKTGCLKGSTWILDVEDGRPLRARYVPPRERLEQAAAPLRQTDGAAS